MAAKESKIKNVALASNDSGSSKDEEHNKNETGTDLGISLDKLSLGPKKKLLVIPLGGLIVHRAHVGDRPTHPKSRRPDFSYGNFNNYKRPYCEGFLKFCFERFEVGLWSSALEHNIHGVLNHVTGGLKSKFLFTMDQKECTDTGFMCLKNKNKPLFLKQLKCIWEKYPNGEYSSSNTLLITGPEIALLNPPNTAISLKEYDFMNRGDDYLGPNGELRAFLNGLAEAKDVQSYVKDHPFGEPAITPSHSDWEYYSKIIRFFDIKVTTGDK
ncbi:hypothetical protein L1887_35223 [Cichorium endivia]|nr:hypothetical protein L1887_35223 [Cichorium endivia]